MSDDAPETGADEETQQEKKFFADRAKTGRATCRKCKQKLEAGKLRLAKAGFNPFGPGLMKQWHHVDCLFEVFTKQRKTTAKIESLDDIEGWSDLDDEDQEEILKHLPGCSKDTRTSSNKTDTKTKTDSTPQKSEKKQKKKDQPSVEQPLKDHKDNSFREFRRLCADIANENTYTGKTALVKDFFAKGTDGKGFKGDLLLWCRLLLPGHVKRVYNLQSKQLVKLFSRIFHTDHDDMLEDLENGDVAETISTFFEKSNHVQPTKKSLLTLPEVDQYLEKLSELSKEDEQINHFKNVVKRCTSNDLKMFIRLIKHDLRINAGPKHILEAVHSDAYQAFQASRDLEAVISKAVNKSSSGVSSPSKKTSLGITVSLMTPVLPMLAEACKSVEFAMKKCPNGMYSEIKYDGERVQLHKKGDDYKFFSRSLKPVLPHKVNQFKDYIPEAFPHGNDLILDCEVLMIDTQTGKPLPFGTLGIHKKNAFKDANVCLFVFDCIYFNGDVLVSRPIKERKKILKDNMTEIPFRILLSEVEEIHKPKDLESMITKVLQQGLEGLVLKDLMSIYEPGKRHWLKVKKDYLFGGAMADSADLVVLGAWFGTGQKGGMMSVFLMGCYDPARQKWCTVTKVHTGHDDKTLERLQDELKMVKISKEASKVPSWLIATKTMIPDFVAKDPKAMPVWEITGAEFTQQHDVHTADGISIRFPRVTKIRDDKNWETATSLPELRALFKKSKNTTDIKFPSTRKEDTDEENESESEAKSSKKTTSKTKSGNMEKNKNSAKKLKMDSSDSDSENETESKSSKKAAVKDKPDKSEKNQKSQKKLKIDSSDSDSEQELKSKSKGKRMAEVKHDDFRKNQKIVKKAKVDSSESDQEHDSESDSKSSKRKAEKRKSEKVEENQQSVKRSREDSSESCEESKLLHGCKRLRIHVRPLSELMPVNTVKTPCSEDSFILDTAESPIIGTYLKHVKSLDSTIKNDAAQDSQGNKKSSETCYENTETFTTSDSSILPQIIALDVEHKINSSNVDQSSKLRGIDINGRSTRKQNSSSDDNDFRHRLKKKLPDVFCGVNIVLPTGITSQDSGTLRRYFIAYGGKILEHSEIHRSTHIVHVDSSAKKLNKEWPKSVKHVQLQWLWDTIKLKKLQKASLYPVTLPLS